MTSLGETGRGRQTDYLLGTALGWDAFDVMRYSGVEALDELFSYDVILVRTAEQGLVDIEPLVDTAATLCIASSARWRRVHGIVSEAELIEQTRTQLVYRMVLAPHLARARHRLRCRSFIEQSLEQIVSSVLENRAPKHPSGLRGLAPLSGEPVAPVSPPSFDAFHEPTAWYRWALVDPDRTKVPRRFVVQYNESDFDFVSRLLEAEGISYFFEQTADGCVLTLSDRPGHTPLFQRDEVHDLVGTIVSGQSREQEVVRAFRAVHRLRPALVTMRDYAWRKSLTTLEASAKAPGPDELEHFEFPAADEDEPAVPGKAPAQFALERLQAERALSSGLSTVRTLEPGYRFRLVDRADLREPAELLVARVETFAAQRSVVGTVLEDERFGLRARGADEPFFENRFEALPAEVRYRPARRAPKPRIFGVQPARVTAEELAPGSPPPELNSDELGRVRVRFPWDQRPNDGTPTSKWIRVAQYWAGAGFGSLYVPRVGHEVLVAFERGNPDRPIIVGRLYNAQSPPPYTEPNTTKSTLKSDSVGQDGSSAEGFNELRFEDAAKKEQIFLHAEKDLDEVVRQDHSTGVGGDQSNSVGGNQSNSVKGNRRHTVDGTELVHVVGNRTTEFDATEAHSVGANRITGIIADDVLTCKNRYLTCKNHQATATADERITVGGVRNVDVTASHLLTTGGSFASSAQSMHAFVSKECHINQSVLIDARAGAAKLTMASGLIVLDNGAGASIALIGSTVMVTSGDVFSSSGTHTLMSSGTNTFMSAGSASVISAGGEVDLSASGNINASGALIKLNG